MRKTSAGAALALSAALLLGACGSDDGGSADSVTTDMGVSVTGAPGEKPELDIPDEDPSGELAVEVLDEGDGREVGEDDFVIANYLGQTWEPRAAAEDPAAPAVTESPAASESGEPPADAEPYIFDNSYDRGSPAGFSLNGVVPGWKDGLAGQKVGSRVILSIPPDQGYGGDPTSDLAADTLVFVVEIVDAVPADAAMSGEPVADLPADLPAVEGEDEPTVTFPATAVAPEASGSTLLVAGDGAELQNNLVVQAVQSSYTTGEVQFSTRSEVAGQAPSGAFTLTPDSLPGLAEALADQKVGSRVLIRISAADNAQAGGEPLAIVLDVIGTFGDAAASDEETP